MSLSFVALILCALGLVIFGYCYWQMYWNYRIGVKVWWPLCILGLCVFAYGFNMLVNRGRELTEYRSHIETANQLVLEGGDTGWFFSLSVIDKTLVITLATLGFLSFWCAIIAGIMEYRILKRPSGRN